MAKQSVTYIGTHDDPTTEIEIGGHTFEKGKVVQLDDKDPAFAKIAANPTFEVGSGATAAAREARKEVAAQEEDAEDGA